MKLTADDWNMLDYFWTEKGDLERWCGWETFRLQPEAAPIVEVWERHKLAEKMVGIVIEGMRP